MTNKSENSYHCVRVYQDEDGLLKALFSKNSGNHLMEICCVYDDETVWGNLEEGSDYDLEGNRLN